MEARTFTQRFTIKIQNIILFCQLKTSFVTITAFFSAKPFFRKCGERAVGTHGRESGIEWLDQFRTFGKDEPKLLTDDRAGDELDLVCVDAHITNARGVINNNTV